MTRQILLNEGWKFSDHFIREMCDPEYDDRMLPDIRIPHTVAITPYHYFDESHYRKISCYRRVLLIDPEWAGKRLFLHFEGIAHTAEVYIDGKLVRTHECGYTAFEAEITELVGQKKEILIAVRVDSTEQQNVPPFGNVVDYMTYGGIYREVWLAVREQIYLQDVFVAANLPDTFVFDKNNPGLVIAPAELQIQISLPFSFMDFAEKVLGQNYFIRQTLQRISLQEQDAAGDAYEQSQLLGTAQVRQETTRTLYRTLPVAIWDVERPALYNLTVELLKGDIILDRKVTRFGFRNAVFRSEGFYLNGRKYTIRGLNRHQSYPYVGYAMPASMQRLDADILKKELCVNAVRTSHYPQSHDFIDRCDELGLLVLMEFPGWQYIGNEEWKDQAIVNLKEMILQYRNHTSIILWGVRINESSDDDAFYQQTNQIAHRLDPARQTGGVRAIKKSNLLEDVYTYNDFSHNGRNNGCEARKRITSERNKPYLITEYNGHMFPTKAFDPENRRMEHAIRHANVLDAVAGQKGICGSFGWCMFDYNTHKDFGSGDRICYHGVMDMFRNPKLAAAVYRSQGDKDTVLEISSGMDIGEHAECIRGAVWIFTNADAVRMYRNDNLIKEYTAADSPYHNLAHGPILIDDYIGNQLVEKEHFSKAKSERIKELLNAAAMEGLGDIALSVKAKALKAAVRYHMKWEDALRLYNKYIGDWGGKSTSFRFEAVCGGKTVKTVIRETMQQIFLRAEADHTDLCEKRTYDVALIRIRATDENGNVLPFCMETVQLETEGALAIIGPQAVPLRGGMAGTYVKTKRQSGDARLHLSCGSQKISILFHISCEDTGNVM